MSTDENRCDWSDLPAETCAHCAGLAPLPVAPEVRPTEPPPGVRIWPPTTAERDERGELGPQLPGTWAPTASAGECRCGKPTRDSAYVCDGCGNLLARALGDVPWLAEQLDIAITKQRAAATGNGARSTETALPWHQKAAEAKRTLHGLLAMWCRFCSEEHITKAALPSDTLPAMSLWLLECIHGLTLRDIGPEAVDEITDAVAECRRIVFYKRRTRVYIGPCEGRDAGDDEAGVIMEDCPGHVYAEEFDPVGYCDDCGRGYTVVIKKANLEKELADRLCPVAEIARFTTYLGLDVPRERVRRQIHSWVKRGRITAASHTPEGEPLYRYETVRVLLYAVFADKEAS